MQKSAAQCFEQSAKQYAVTKNRRSKRIAPAGLSLQILQSQKSTASWSLSSESHIRSSSTSAPASEQSVFSLSSRDVFVVAILDLCPNASLTGQATGVFAVFADQSNDLEEKVGDEEAQQAEQSNNLYRNTASAAGFCRKSALCGALLSASRNIPLSQARSRLFL